MIAWTDRHGISPLAQEGLDAYVQACPGIHARKQSWPPVLEVESPDTLEPKDGAVSFRARTPDLDDLAETVRRYKEKTSQAVLVATITGEVKTRRDLKIVRHGDDIIGNGYGQGGACPRLLVVKTVVGAEDSETHVLISLLRTQDTTPGSTVSGPKP